MPEGRCKERKKGWEENELCREAHSRDARAHVRQRFNRWRLLSLKACAEVNVYPLASGVMNDTGVSASSGGSPGQALELCPPSRPNLAPLVYNPTFHNPRCEFFPSYWDER